MPILTIDGVDDAIISEISLPVVAGGACVCTFVAYEDLAISAFIIVRDLALVKIFEGNIRSKSRNISKSESGIKRSYTAVCKAFYDASQTDFTVTDLGNENDDFSGNGVEHQEWLIRENANKHVIWPPVGSAHLIFTDTDPSVVLPPNRISISEVEENDLPSHVKVDVRQWREKRFPCKADFDPDLKVTPDLLQKDPNFANWGRRYKIMDPADPTMEFIDSILQNAKTGGTKFFVKDGLLEASPPAATAFEPGNYAFSASINPKKTHLTLTKVGSPLPPPEVPSPPSKEFKNFAQVNMNFFFGFILPRVKGNHGAAADEQQTFVRARQLEGVQSFSSLIGGVNQQHRIATLDHTEIDVEFDTFNGILYRDWTYGGPPELLSLDLDKGDGVWTSDLTGSYIQEEGNGRAFGLVSSALNHYLNIKFTTDIELAGYVSDLNFRVDVNGFDVVLDQITWSFGLNPSENRTRYSGVRTLNGFSPALRAKEKWVQKQEIRRVEKNDKIIAIEDKPGEAPNKTRLRAKVLWQIDGSGNDLSEAEFVQRSDSGWNNTGELCWIDFQNSRGTGFNTAGDATIFEVEFIKPNIIRTPVATPITRDLFKTLTVVDDKGQEITHCRTVAQSPFVTRFISQDNIAALLWIDIENNGDAALSYIKTTIGAQPAAINQAISNIEKRWDILGSGSEDFLYMRQISTHRIPFKFTDIRAQFKELNTWESGEKKVDGITPIATYREFVQF